MSARSATSLVSTCSSSAAAAGSGRSHSPRSVCESWVSTSPRRSFGTPPSASSGVPFLQASAEAIPIAPASFDVVFCDHGAMTFADPDSSVPEVARVLRPGGRLVFCHTTPLRVMCLDDEWQLTTTLHRDAFGMKRVTDGESVDFVLPHGEWIRLFRRHGLVVDDLIELQPAPDATTTYPWYASIEWASQLARRGDLDRPQALSCNRPRRSRSRRPTDLSVHATQNAGR